MLDKIAAPVDVNDRKLLQYFPSYFMHFFLFELKFLFVAFIYLGN